MVRNRAKGSDLDSAGRCYKYMLFAANIVFWLLSCALIGVTVWILVDKIYIGYIFDSVLFKVAAWMVIVGGCFGFFCSFVGCCGALIENKIVLIVYFISLMTIALILLTGGILAVVFRHEIGEEMREHMRKSLITEYGFELDKRHNRMVTDAWDSMQSELYCCGIDQDSWSVYRGSRWFQNEIGVIHFDKAFVPKSCCARNQYDDYINLQKCQTYSNGPPGKPGGEENEALQTRGCYRAGINFVKDYTSVVCGIAIAVAIIFIFGIVFSVLLIQKIDH